MAEIIVSVQAYCKMMLHVAKYPHCAVNGVFLAEKPKSRETRTMVFVDCIPLFHLSLGLAPMLEVALTQIDAFCKSQGLVIGGYYQANEHFRDSKPNHIAIKVADRIHDHCSDACLFMIDNQRVLEDSTEAYNIYQFHENKWKQRDYRETLEEGAIETLSSLLKTKIYRSLSDFDNHLDDISDDWRNPEIDNLLKMTS